MRTGGSIAHHINEFFGEGVYDFIGSEKNKNFRAINRAPNKGFLGENSTILTDSREVFGGNLTYGRLYLCGAAEEGGDIPGGGVAAIVRGKEDFF